jgi:hypothetical protein
MSNNFSTDAVPPELQIDARVKSLVRILNAFPGVLTLSSCGGHAEKTNFSQADADSFYVNMEMDPLRGGWRSLQLITFAIAETHENTEFDEEQVDLSVWTNGGTEGLCFEVKGSDGADPDSLALELERALELYNVTDDEVDIYGDANAAITARKNLQEVMQKAVEQ